MLSLAIQMVVKRKLLNVEVVVLAMLALLLLIHMHLFLVLFQGSEPVHVGGFFKTATGDFNHIADFTLVTIHKMFHPLNS